MLGLQPLGGFGPTGKAIWYGGEDGGRHVWRGGKHHRGPLLDTGSKP